jgi:uncharacterized membrane protein HdeD (DUF308 family)
MRVLVDVVDWRTVARNWWVVLLRGLAGILFGIVTVIAPGISLSALVLVWGAYALADGIRTRGGCSSCRESPGSRPASSRSRGRASPRSCSST